MWWAGQPPVTLLILPWIMTVPAIHNLDDCHILFFTREEAKRINKDVKEGKDTNDYECEAWMYWTNWNDGTERVVDYTTNLNKLIGIDKIMDNWEKQFDKLKQTL